MSGDVPAAAAPVARLRAYLDELDAQTRLPGEPPLREAVAEQARQRLAEMEAQRGASERRFGPHRVIGEFSGDPSCAVCHHAWPCPTAKQATASEQGESRG